MSQCKLWKIKPRFDIISLNARFNIWQLPVELVKVVEISYSPWNNKNNQLISQNNTSIKVMKWQYLWNKIIPSPAKHHLQVSFMNKLIDIPTIHPLSVIRSLRKVLDDKTATKHNTKTWEDHYRYPNKSLTIHVCWHYTHELVISKKKFAQRLRTSSMSSSENASIMSNIYILK